MNVDVAESIREYISTSMETIAREGRKSKLLMDELNTCKLTIVSLLNRISVLEHDALRTQARQRVSVFKFPHQKSGGVAIVDLKRSISYFSRVCLTSEDPCPTPHAMVNGVSGQHYVIDPGLTMCDIWSTWHKHEIVKQRIELRQEKRRDTYTKKTVCEAFGCYALHADSPLYHAAVGFMKGSQQQNQTGKNERRRSTAAFIGKEDKDPETRCMQKDRKNLLALMVNHMYDGTIGRDIEIAVLKRKRFSTVSLARVSDMHSTFNPSSLGSIAKCEGGKLKGEMGLLCSESTLRRTMDIVHDQAVQLGFSTMPEDGKGKVWCWGDGSGLLEKAINLYVKAVYYDACCDSVTVETPWIVPISGDAARTSQRGTVVTVMGPKQSDGRLKNQERTGQSLMCQSCDMYTPAVAGYASETELMEYFHALLRGFQQIERQGYCIVNGHTFKVPIQVHVVADLSFLHKYVKRGGSSASASCFCMMCSAFRNFRHEGYPGGCWKCRRRGCVYGRDGLQQCKHHDSCTAEFLEWQTERYAELCVLVPKIPLTVLPAWESVDELRRECQKRCIGEHASQLKDISRKSGPNHYTGEQLTTWILAYCRGGCTLTNDLHTGVMHCDITIVNQCLAERHVSFDGLADAAKRSKMLGILQLEQELTKITMYMRDQRFTPTHASARALPMERIILCLLHLPMRTHEKVLTLLFHSACEGRTHKKSKPVLDAMAAILRRIGRMSGNWTYKMDEKNTTIVQKIKLPWDQSKTIFKEENMKELQYLVRLAVPHENQAHWVSFLREYIKCINLLTVSRDYTTNDLKQLELSGDETFRLLVAHCGGDKAVTNYFHYIGAGHVLWMCQLRGNIWRYRNEGVEAFNKTLSKRCNMFNSSGNKGNLKNGGKVEPFEVLGKWMGRYAMWQLGFAQNLFIDKGGVLGPSEISWDPDSACFISKDDNASHSDDDDDSLYYASDATSDTDSDNLDVLTPEELSMCRPEIVEGDVHIPNLRKRHLT